MILFGYNLHITTIGAADELAAAASLVMGQANEGNSNRSRDEGSHTHCADGNLQELLRPKEQDLFR